MSRKLAATVHVDGVIYKAGSEVDDKVAKKITNPKAWPKGESKASEGDGGGSRYASMDKGELEAEVAKRNEGRDDEQKVVVGGRGNKPDLVKALEADDAAAENTGE